MPTRDTLGRHLRAMVMLAPGPTRLLPATKAAITVLLCLGVPTAFGRLDLGLLAVTGTFAVLYAPGAPLRRRAATVAGIGAGLVGSAALGACTAASPALFAAAAVVLSMTAAGLSLALRVGPPGSYFLVLVAGIAHYLVAAHGTAPVHVVGMTAVGATVALVVTLLDLAPDPRRPERAAVDAATRTVEDYAATPPGPEGRPLHRAAALALAAAEEAVAEGARPVDPVMADRLERARRGYEQRAARPTAHFLPGGDLPWDAHNPDAGRWLDPAHEAGADEVDLPDAAAARRAGRALAADERRHIRSLRRRLGDGLRYPGEPWIVAAAVGVATTASTLVLTAIAGPGQAHLYWAIAFSALVLHQGGPRVTRTYRAVHRLVGTLAGLGVFLVLASLRPSGWWVVAVVVAFQFVIELLVARNYGLAVMLITPLALLVSTGGRLDGEPWGLVGERLLNTVVGVVVALVVLWTTGRRAPHRAVWGDTRRVLVELAEVERGRGQSATEPTLASALRDLHTSAALLAADGHRDAPEARTAETVVHAGFLVLGAADPRAVAAAAGGWGELAEAPLPSGRTAVADDHPADEAIREACARVGGREL